MPGTWPQRGLFIHLAPWHCHDYTQIGWAGCGKIPIVSLLYTQKNNTSKYTDRRHSQPGSSLAGAGWFTITHLHQLQSDIRYGSYVSIVSM